MRHPKYWMAIKTNIPAYGNIFYQGETFDDLRSISPLKIRDGYSAIVRGQTTVSDGLGGLFAWKPTSTAADDNETVIAPTAGGQGRWVKIAVGQRGDVGPKGDSITGPRGLKGDPGGGLTDVMQPTGAALVGFKQDAPNAIAATVAEQLRPIKSVTGWGANADGSLTKDAMLQAITHAWDDARAGGFNLFFPSGVYDIGEYSFPWRQAFGVDELYDCRNVTIHGDGPETIFMTTSATGADVFQLDRVKNLHLRNLKITSKLTGFLDAGSNGISVTGGFDNISILDVWIENLAFVDKVLNVDGGKGLTLQLDSATQSLGSLTARIFVKGCAQGFGLELNPEQCENSALALNVDIVAEDCYQAVNIGGAEAKRVIRSDAMSAVRVTAQAINCQHDVFIGRAMGAVVDCQIATSKTAAARRLSPAGTAWRATDTTVDALNCASAINCPLISVTGDKGACDYKAQIGAANPGQSQLTGASQNTNFTIDVGGTATIADIRVVADINSDTVRNSRLTVSAKTGVVPAALYGSTLNNVIIQGNVPRLISMGLAGPLTLLDSVDGRTSVGVLTSGNGYPIIRQTTGSPAGLLILGYHSDANTRVFGVRNDGAMHHAAALPAVPMSATPVKMIPEYDTANVLMGYRLLYTPT